VIMRAEERNANLLPEFQNSSRAGVLRTE